MTRFLLDRDAMSQLDRAESMRHANVKAWLASVDDDTLYVSAITVMEAWKGFATIRKRWPNDLRRLHLARTYETGFERLLAAFAGRIVPVDEAVAALWGQMLGEQDRHRFDTGLAATAVIHEMVVVTRNIRDFAGRRTKLIDPFSKRPRIVEQ